MHCHVEGIFVMQVLHVAVATWIKLNLWLCRTSAVLCQHCGEVTALTACSTPRQGARAMAGRKSSPGNCTIFSDGPRVRCARFVATCQSTTICNVLQKVPIYNQNYSAQPRTRDIGVSLFSPIWRRASPHKRIGICRV